MIDSGTSYKLFDVEQIAANDRQMFLTLSEVVVEELGREIVGWLVLIWHYGLAPASDNNPRTLDSSSVDENGLVRYRLAPAAMASL